MMLDEVLPLLRDGQKIFRASGDGSIGIGRPPNSEKLYFYGNNGVTKELLTFSVDDIMAIDWWVLWDAEKM